MMPQKLTATFVSVLAFTVWIRTVLADIPSLPEDETERAAANRSAASAEPYFYIIAAVLIIAAALIIFRILKAGKKKNRGTGKSG